MSGGSGCDYFFEASESGVRFFYAAITQVNMHRRPVFCGEAEHLDNFSVSSGGGIVDAHAFGERALPKSFLNATADGRKFFRSGGATRSVSSREKAAGVVHHFHADGNVADAGAEIDQRLPFPGGIPLRYVCYTRFQFQGRRDAIVRLELIVAGLLAMFVEIDEAGSDDQPLRVDGSLAGQRLFRNRCDFSSAQSDVAIGIEAGFGIHYAAVGNDYIV